MTDIPGAYAAGRRRLTELVADLDPSRASTVVPACPEWTVHDVVAHVVGICDDILAGNIAGVATDPWTAAQVEKQRRATLAEMTAEWAENAPQVEALFPAFPGESAAQLVADLTTHEHDIRGALGATAARDSEGVKVAVDFGIGVLLGPALDARDLGAVEIETQSGNGPRVAGTNGRPAARLRTTEFELMRCMTGRRSRQQVLSLDWSVDAEPYADAFNYPPFSPPAEDLVE